MFGKLLREKIEELNLINEKISATKAELSNLESEKAELQNYNEALRIFIDMGQSYIPADSLDELEIKRQKAQDLVVNSLKDGVYKIIHNCQMNNSYKMGKNLQKIYGEGLMYSLSAYIDQKEKTVTLDNFSTQKKLIEKKFNDYQKRATLIGVALNKEYVENRFDLMKVKAEIKEAKKFRAYEERIERARLQEEQKVLEEAENERKRLKLEKEAMDLAFAKALTEEERDRIKNELAQIDMRLEDIDYRIRNQRAGYLYIIDSESLPDMIKIGATRRLNPAIRVKELSSSSLPFPFRLRAFCFCDDVFDLESKMHEYFDSRRVSPQREFFYVSPHEAIEVLINKFNKEVHFGTYEENNESEDDE